MVYVKYLRVGGTTLVIVTGGALVVWACEENAETGPVPPARTQFVQVSPLGQLRPLEQQ
jgi:hypothetical protein